MSCGPSLPAAASPAYPWPNALSLPVELEKETKVVKPNVLMQIHAHKF